VDRETLSKHISVPTTLVYMIKNSYNRLNRRVVHEGLRGQHTVRQGCLLPATVLAIDWIIEMSTEQRRNGIQWTLWTQLDDLDFADDLALLSHNHQHMQKITAIADTSAQVGLNIQGSTLLAWGHSGPRDANCWGGKHKSESTVIAIRLN